MDIEAFITWALAEQRTIEERFTVECMVDVGLRQWHWRRQIYQHESLDDIMRKQREQSLNPAYLPDYSEESLRKATEAMPAWTDWSNHNDRPIRDVAAFEFLPNLESVTLPLKADVADLTPLTRLPKLCKLSIGSIGHLFGGQSCEDYTPLARCSSLRELSLAFAFPWPDFSGIEALEQLEVLHLTGNLLALPRDVAFPNVKIASLRCQPLAMRDVRDMPNVPACEFLTLSGADTLRGIEEMPRLRNLTLVGAFKSYEPLAALPHLTALQVDPDSATNLKEQPFDLTPINRIPSLLYYQYGRPYEGYDLRRDYSQLTDSPTLREIFIQGCSDVSMEVASINAGLLGWDDLLLAPSPKQCPARAKFVVAPDKAFPGDKGPANEPAELILTDKLLFKPRSRWLARCCRRAISKVIGHSDWGLVDCSGYNPCFFTVQIESYEVVERLPEILEAARLFTATLRHQYDVGFWILLKVPPPEPSPALQELEAELRKRQDQWEDDEHERKRTIYLKNVSRLQLKEEEGGVINPEEYSPEESPPYPTMEDLLAEKEQEEDDESEDGDDFVAVATEFKKNPYFEDENAHPLADSYNLMGKIYLDAVYFRPGNRDIAIHLMQREPDIDIPEPEKAEE